MSQGDDKNTEFDPEFTENFYKNLDKVLGEVESQPMDVSASPQEKLEITRTSELDVTESSKLEIAANIPLGTNINTEENLTDGVEDALTEINASLAQQICEELHEMSSMKKKKKMNRTMKIQLAVLVSLLCLISIAGFLGLTDSGNKVLMKMGVDVGGKIWATWTQSFDKDPVVSEDIDILDQEDLESDAKEIDPSTIVWPEHGGEGRKEEGVYNILILGEEAIGSGSSRGRTDVIMIATLNTKSKEVKLTSLLRDTLVRIPGYQDNKLNSAYEKGGVDLLYQTIALNYDIHLDGAAMVNFEKFEKIIDKLGGLELTLTANEARYLNNTNYISNPKYRTVREGTQLMNGNQVLGYARIRKRATIHGTNNDYGRTERHRMILEAVFNKYKTESKMELASILFGLLPMITTDINSENFELLLNSFIEMKTLDIQQLRIPKDGTFTDNIKVRGMDVLVPEWDANRKELHEFIFGSYVY